MAYTGTKTYSVTRDNVIQAALRKLGEYDSADGVAAPEVTDAAFALNVMVKEWSAEGLGLWLRQESVLFLQSGQRRYSLDSAGTDHWFDLASVYEAPLASAWSSGSVLSITDTTWTNLGVAASANKPGTTGTTGIVGVRLDSGVMLWTYATAVGTANQITVNSAWVSTASAGRMVYYYVKSTGAAGKVARPLRILTAQREDTSGNVAIVSLIGRDEYERLSRKTTSGDPIKVMFDPHLSDGTTGNGPWLYVWPTSNNLTTDKLILVTETYADDVTGATDNPQFPIEWANALIWGLAAELAAEYGIAPDHRSYIEQKAMQKKASLFLNHDRENASVEFAPELTVRQ